MKALFGFVLFTFSSVAFAAAQAELQIHSQPCDQVSQGSDHGIVSRTLDQYREMKFETEQSAAPYGGCILAKSPYPNGGMFCNAGACNSTAGRQCCTDSVGVIHSGDQQSAESNTGDPSTVFNCRCIPAGGGC